MTISRGNVGAFGAGTNTVLVPYPTGVAVGDKLVIFVGFKGPTNDEAAAAPPGWMSSGRELRGTGADGNVDEGICGASLITKIAGEFDVSQSRSGGKVLVTFTGTNPNSCVAAMAQYKTTTAWLDDLFSTGSTVSATQGFTIDSAGSLLTVPGSFVVCALATQSQRYIVTGNSSVLSQAGTVPAGADPRDRAQGGTTNGTHTSVALIDGPWTTTTLALPRAVSNLSDVPNGGFNAAASGAWLTLRESAALPAVESSLGTYDPTVAASDGDTWSFAQAGVRDRDAYLYEGLPITYTSIDVGLRAASVRETPSVEEPGGDPVPVVGALSASASATTTVSGVIGKLRAVAAAMLATITMLVIMGRAWATTTAGTMTAAVASILGRVAAITKAGQATATLAGTKITVTPGALSCSGALTATLAATTIVVVPGALAASGALTATLAGSIETYEPSDVVPPSRLRLGLGMGL